MRHCVNGTGILAAIFCLEVLLAAGCQRPQAAPSGFTIEHEIAPQPPRVGLVTVTFRMADAASKPVTGAHIQVEGDMSHAGMAPVFADAREVEPGRYQAALNFSMAGDWVVLLHIELQGGEKVERQFDVGGVVDGTR